MQNEQKTHASTRRDPTLQTIHARPSTKSGVYKGITAKGQQPAISLAEDLMVIYTRMETALGDLHWWPAESATEMIIGAILVQNVAWSNARTAIVRLQEHGLLDFDAIQMADSSLLEECVRCTRFYKSKAAKLLAFANHIHTVHYGQLQHLLQQPLVDLRKELLAIHGIGPETADDIILYAAHLPSFVIDAYTKRIVSRLGYCTPDIHYDSLREWFMTHLPHNVPLYNQYHALLDAVGHRYCKTQKPLCSQCPLAQLCPASERVL